MLASWVTPDLQLECQPRGACVRAKVMLPSVFVSLHFEGKFMRQTCWLL